MDKRELAELLMATFVGELDERVQALNRDLLALEQRPPADQRAELLKTLFRSAHSLKGAARAVNVELIESACHRLEEVLSAVRDGRLSLEPEHFGLLFSVVDAVQDAGQRLRGGRELQGAPLEQLLAPLDQAFVPGAAAAPPPAVAVPPAAPSAVPTKARTPVAEE